VAIFVLESDLLDALEELRDELNADGIRLLVYGQYNNDVNLRDIVERAPATPVTTSFRKGKGRAIIR